VAQNKKPRRMAEKIVAVTSLKLIGLNAPLYAAQRAPRRLLSGEFQFLCHFGNAQCDLITTLVLCRVKRAAWGQNKTQDCSFMRAEPFKRTTRQRRC
jgi:hypothetical protein